MREAYRPPPPSPRTRGAPKVRSPLRLPRPIRWGEGWGEGSPSFSPILTHMNRPALLAASAGLLVLGIILSILYSPTEDDHRATINQTIDAFHQAAADADLDAYFNLLTHDARFLGTDETERWTKSEFRAYCTDRGAFNEAPAWVYTPSDRSVTFAPENDLAWFDENLTNAKYGTLRGSGVLVRNAGAWKIAQYNLTFLIPNDAAPAVVEAIMETTDAADEDQSK